MSDEELLNYHAVMNKRALVELGELKKKAEKLKFLVSPKKDRKDVLHTKFSLRISTPANSPNGEQYITTFIIEIAGKTVTYSTDPKSVTRTIITRDDLLEYLDYLAARYQPSNAVPYKASWLDRANNFIEHAKSLGYSTTGPKMSATSYVVEISNNGRVIERVMIPLCDDQECFATGIVSFGPYPSEAFDNLLTLVINALNDMKRNIPKITVKAPLPQEIKPETPRDPNSPKPTINLKFTKQANSEGQKESILDEVCKNIFDVATRAGFDVTVTQRNRSISIKYPNTATIKPDFQGMPFASITLDGSLIGEEILLITANGRLPRSISEAPTFCSKLNLKLQEWIKTASKT